MDSVWNVWRRHTWRALSAGGLLLAGCVTSSSSVAPLPEMLVVAPEAHPVVHAEAPATGPLTLERLQALAEENQPDLASARARAEAARGRLVQAGLYPNPTVVARIDE